MLLISTFVLLSITSIIFGEPAYAQTYSLTFNAIATPPISNVDGATVVIRGYIGATPFTVTYAELPKTFTNITLGTTITYNYEAIIPTTVSGKRYRFLSATGPTSGFSLSADTVIVGNYQTQYYLAVNRPSGATGSGEGWYDAGSSAIVSCSNVWNEVAGRVRSNLKRWHDGTTYFDVSPRSGSGSYSITILMNSPRTITFEGVTQYSLSISGGADIRFDPPSPTNDHWFDAGMSITVYCSYVKVSVPNKVRERIVSYTLDDVTNSITPAASGSFSIPNIVFNTYHTLIFNSIKQYFLMVNGGNNVNKLYSQFDDGWYDEGTEARVVTDYTWNVIDGKSRMNLKAWSIDGGELQYIGRRSSGRFTTPSIIMNNYRTVNFHAVTQYYLSLRTSVSGATVSQSGSQTNDNWYDEGSSATISASSPYTIGTTARYVFARWNPIEGSPLGFPSESNPANVIMSSHFIIEAEWVRDRVILDQASNIRVDVGSTAVIRMHYVWESDGTNVVGFDIHINGTVYKPDGSGWITFLYSQPTIGKKVWLTTYANGGFNFVNRVMAQVIFDRIGIVVKGASAYRVNVGSPVTVWFSAIYEYDQMRFDGDKGLILINDEPAKWNSFLLRWELTASSQSVGMKRFSVSSIQDRAYGLKVFNDVAGSVSIIWDRVKVSGKGTSNPRVDIDTPSIVYFELNYEYDGEVVSDGSVSIRGMPARYNPITKRWELNVSLPTVGRESYYVTSVSGNKYGITILNDLVGPQDVIWDRLEVYQGGVDRERIDWNSSGTIWFKVRYQYDNIEFTKDSGSIILNGSLPMEWSPSKNRWEYRPSLNRVGRLALRVDEIKDNLYGLSSHKRLDSVGTRSIIWDTVNITLSVQQSRIDVGSSANISAKGFYQFDNSEFVGSIILNDAITKLNVGLYNYTVSKIIDNKYGLKTFRSNVISVIFDTVNVTLSSVERIEVGRNANIVWSAHYLYDGKPFNGTITLNDESMKTQIGRYQYTVKSIVDRSYGLTSFKSNVIHITFDRLQIEYRLQSFFPGSLKVVVTLKYQSDDAPVERASVTVNGIEARESSKGLYEVDLTTWNPVQGITIMAKVSEPMTNQTLFSPLVIDVTAYHLGNILSGVIAQVTLIITIIVLYLQVWKKRRISATQP
ncbi:MAG: hypothetical protein RMJ31_02775 [Nitrososphaerota archaeon]|nr:hypothetical protein [Nitrososphaerota archaeon]